MDLIERLIGMFRRGFDMVCELWPVKLFYSCISALFCYLFGGSGAILVVVVVFIVLDTLTKWVAITKRFLIDQGAKEEELSASALMCGFFYAWKPGYLSSTALRKCWGEKLFTYCILIVFAGLMAKLPEISLFGLPVNKSISGGIYTCIALTELFSITENLEDMGNKKLGQLKQFLCNLVARITGGGYSVMISNQPGALPMTQSTNKEGGAVSAAGKPGSHPDDC